MNIFNLFGTIALKDEGYKQGIDEAKAKNVEFEQSAEKASAGANIAFTAIIGVVIKLIAEMKKLIVNTLNYADTFDDLSAKYDTTSKQMQELGYIAGQTATDVNSVASAMSMMYMKAKESNDAFAKIGVSVTDTDGKMKSMVDLFWESKEALDNIEDSGQKSAMMLDIFGRSAMTNGEFFRKDTQELKAMAQEANDLGIIMSEDVTKAFGKVNDEITQLKTQFQSVMASLLAGEEDAQDKVDLFFENLTKKVEKYAPVVTKFAVQLLITVFKGLVAVMPRLAGDLVYTFINAIFATDWIKVGIDIGKSILEGIINAFGKVLKIFGINVPDVKLGRSSDYTRTDIGANDYEITERSSSKIEVSLNVSGDGTAVSSENAKVVGDEIANRIDVLLGGKI